MIGYDFRLETAACLWEGAMALREAAMKHGDDKQLEDIFLQFQAHGMAGMRLHITGMTDDCVRAWEACMSGLDEYDGSFDWDFCPALLRSAVDWSGLEPVIDTVKLGAFVDAERLRHGVGPINIDEFAVQGKAA